METQQYLAEYIKYGYYHMYKSDQKATSNARIIVSTNHDLQALVQEGKFSKILFDEFSKALLTMPSLLSLPQEELAGLIDGFAEQANKETSFNNLLALNEKDKEKLLGSRPVSLYEFKNKIQQFLINKSKKQYMYQETYFDPAYNVSDPELMQAARLGKRALKDPAIMSLLWNKFKNQNKIAEFLGVNRSSVNRRCKEYNLE